MRTNEKIFYKCFMSRSMFVLDYQVYSKGYKISDDDSSFRRTESLCWRKVKYQMITLYPCIE